MSIVSDTINAKKGGGFQPFEEFLDEYVDTEIMKVERRDSIKKGSVPNLEEVKEDSPSRAARKSPTASKMSSDKQSPTRKSVRV